MSDNQNTPKKYTGTIVDTIDDKVIVAVHTTVRDCRGCYYSCPSRQDACNNADCILSTTGDNDVIYKKLDRENVISEPIC
jgi:hypothetical protein